VARIGGDEFAIILPRVNAEQAQLVKNRILERLKARVNFMEGFAISLSIGVETAINEITLDQAFKKADDEMYKEKMIGSTRLKKQIFGLLEKRMMLRDWMSPIRLKLIQDAAKAFAYYVGLSEKELKDLLTLSKYHDIGNSILDEHIFTCANKLAEQELQIMRSHVEAGRRICSCYPSLTDISDYLYYHHEWWNGTGYPIGIEGKKIPLIARIFSIIDAFEAMTGERPYQTTKKLDEAIAELKEKSGTQFDPILVQVFCDKVLPAMEHKNETLQVN
ncbi:MAG: HD domain-containing phosphohydrolase, partial [Bacillota bacterium]|nr:HD domain-containing phosphohydrolase [Bacillota bacterium]